MGETSGALGVGGELLGGSDRQGLGGVCAGTEPRWRAGEVPGGPPCGEATWPTGGWSGPGGLGLAGPGAACGHLRGRCVAGARLPRRCRPAAEVVMRKARCPRVGGARAPALECCDTHQVRQEAAVPCVGARGSGGASQPRGVTEKNVRPQATWFQERPREVAFDQSMGQGGTHRVRAALGGGTARERGQPCDGGARGLLGLGSTPLHLHVSSRIRARHGVMVWRLWEARGIRSETPPAGASTEPLDGRSEDNPARSVLWASVWSMPASERERGHMKGRQKAGENCRAAA